jgi:hypothetical protein
MALKETGAWHRRQKANPEKQDEKSPRLATRPAKKIGHGN